jgi:hypothetical protein
MGVALVTPRRSRPFPRRPLALAAAAIVVGVVAAVMSGILSPWYYAVTMRRPPRPLDVPDPRPRFLWVLLFDPHTPYDPPEPFRSRHAGRPYDGEIAYMDSQLGRLLEAARGTGRDWLTVVAGDHGEGLGDHDELTHGFPPTMLELAALPGLDGVDGRSLVDAIAGRPALHGPVYMESYHPRDWWGAAEITALRTAEWLFVESPRPELYDVVADPGERTNLAIGRRQVVAEFRETLKGFAAELPAADRAPLDAVAEARLRSLGYLGGSRPVGASTDAARPNAKDNGPMLAAITEGHELVVQGRHADALEWADERLGAGAPAEAQRAYRAALATGIEQPEIYSNLGLATWQLKQRDETLVVLDRAVARFPNAAELHYRRGRVLQDLGRPADALAAYRVMIGLAPGHPQTLAAIAAIERR